MKTFAITSILLYVTAGLTGCASVDFYEEKDDGTEENTGFLYYPPKPYLLIETKDNQSVSSIISLPDLSKPHRVKQSNGWGSAELGFEIENGMIKSFNSKTDSKGPDTLTSIAGLGSAKAAITTANATMLAEELSIGDTETVELADGNKREEPISYRIKSFASGSNELLNKVLPALNKNSDKFSFEIESIKQTATELSKKHKIDFDPNKPDALLQSVEERRVLAKQEADRLGNVSSTLTVYADNKADKPALMLVAKEANDQLKPIIKSLLEFSLRSKQVNGLYEIGYVQGRLNLRKVLIE